MIAGPNIISISSLLAQRKPNKAFQRVKQEIAENKGKAVVWVFPYYSQLHVFDADGNFLPIFARGRMPMHTDFAEYQRFLSQITQAARENSFTLFAFTDPIDFSSVQESLLEIAAQRHSLVHVPTEKEFSNPDIPGIYGNEKAWANIAGLFDSLGITHIDIVGELGFTVNSSTAGCVHKTKDWLKSMTNANVKVLRRLMFPNVNLNGRGK